MMRQLQSDSPAGEVLSQVPESWTVTKLRRVLAMPITDGPHETPMLVEEGIPFISAEAVSSGYGSINFAKMRGFITEDYCAQCDLKYVPKRDDIYMIKSGATTGRVAMVETDRRFTIWSPLAAIRANGAIIMPRFLFYALTSDAFQIQVEMTWNFGTQQNIGMRALERLLVAVPPRREQAFIVKHLDTVTAEIDGVKSKLREQRKHLESYKQQTIAKTVKHGLNNEVPTKNSGIAWIGSVPSHWDIRTLSYLTDENKVKNTDLREKNLLSLSYGRLIRKDIEDAFGLLPASFDGYQIVEDGYIILRMTDLQNDHRSLRTALATERGIITNAYIGLIPRPGVSSRYLAWMLRAIDLQKIFYGLGSGVRQSLNYNELRKLPALLPPLDEQEAIADFIDGKSDEINALIADIDRQVELLDTYRKQLISDVVTGKIRVSEDAS